MSRISRGNIQGKTLSVSFFNSDGKYYWANSKIKSDLFDSMDDCQADGLVWLEMQGFIYNGY
jgi:hypothetical protein